MSGRVTAEHFAAGGRRGLGKQQIAALQACLEADQLAAGYINQRDSQFTRDDYKRVLTDWLWWCRGRYLDPFAVVGDHVSAWRDDLSAEPEPLQPGTVRRYLFVLSGFYRYLAEQPTARRVQMNPVLWVDRPARPDAAETRWLDTADALRLLSLADLAGPRALALTSLFLLYGQPPSGVGQLNCSDLQPDGQDGPTIRLHARRGYRPTVRLVNPALGALLDLAAGHHGDAPLFPGRATARLGRHAAAIECANINLTTPGQPLFDADGKRRRITPKLLTSTFVVLAARAGAAVDDVSELTGFEYARFTATAQRAALQPTELITRYLTDYTSEPPPEPRQPLDADPGEPSDGRGREQLPHAA